MDDKEIFAINSENDAETGTDDLGLEVPREVIKVVGIGGAGGNALNTIINSGVTDVDFIAANTDVAALRLSQAPTRIILGKSLIRRRTDTDSFRIRYGFHHLRHGRRHRDGCCACYS